MIHEPMSLGALAAGVLSGASIDREQAFAVLNAPDEDLPEVLQAAFRVRERYWGRRVKICLLRNARSGLCPEDCHYCSQSAISDAAIPRYRLDSVAGAAGAERGAPSRPGPGATAWRPAAAGRAQPMSPASRPRRGRSRPSSRTSSCVSRSA